jgi:hypothetical protein
VRFGVTGHQILPAAIVERAVAHWRQVLPTGPQLCGVSNLAEGADQLFAAHVLAAGGELEAIVPCQGYAGALATDDGRAEFERLRAAARTVVTLPYPVPSEEAFLAAGQAMVDRCDHLFAIWDGRPARGLGGTADIVRYAESCGRALTVLWIDGVVRV